MEEDCAFFATQFATRFLLPFSFDGRRIGEVKRALQDHDWKGHGPHENYRRDFHRRFLDRCFGKDGDWNLFQYDVNRASKKPGQEFEIHFAKQHRFNGELWNQDQRDIELLISSQGVGLVSITVTLEGARPEPKADELGRFSLSQIKTFIYQLSQDSGARNRAQITKLRGEKYELTTLSKILESLLDPIREFGFRTRSDLPLLVPYTVVRFAKNISFTSLLRPANIPPEDDLAAHASVMAQVAEAPHPLPVQEDHGAIVRIFHTDELFAVSSMGAALLIADVGRQFDKQKLQNRLDKYFLCFATAIMQRIRLLEILDEAGDVARFEESRDAEKETETLHYLRQHMLATVTQSDLVEISSRDTINRFYRLCQEAQGVPRALALVQQTVSELDASLRAEHQVNNLKHMAATQSKVEWIEIFIVSFYSAELVEMLGRQNHLNESYVAYCTVGMLILVGAIALALIRPWSHQAGVHTKYPIPKSVVTAVMFIITIITAYLLVGSRLKNTDETQMILRHLDDQTTLMRQALDRNSLEMQRLTGTISAFQQQTHPKPPDSVLPKSSGHR